MTQKLFCLFNRLKSSFAEEIIDTLKTKGTKITFEPCLRINLPRDNDELFEDITEIEYDPKENIWYVHNYITEVDLMTGEYWTPIRDLSFDELFKIDERI